MGVGIRSLELLSKPLIVLSLIGHYVRTTEAPFAGFLAALGFCWLGDVLLLFDSTRENFLIYGLLSFLIGHCFLIVSYSRYRSVKNSGALEGSQRLRLAFPVILAGTGLVVILYPVLGDLRIPVMVYSLALTVMVVAAIERLGRTSRKSYWMVLAGALLFMTSDSILAINRFLNPVAYASVLIMLTYCLAQWLIVQGILAHTGD